MVSEMESVNKNAANNSAYVANTNSQPVHSPQSVGIEFVRQYYTMLNRAPHLLFRFYSEDSTFVHGCLDKQIDAIQYVRGQKQINAKIMSLNFKNCHTKIRQVDSMETIGNGVVIQVIGELSNNSQPMRRFLQSFVLTPQSPNKYYVRNDIFRYQDEVYVEENDEHNEKSDIDSKLEATSEAESLPSTEIDKEFNYQSNGNDVIEVNAEENVDSVEEPETVKESADVNNEIFEEIETPYQLGEEQTNNEDEADSASDFGSSNNPSDEPKTYANMVSKSFQAAVAANNLNQIQNKSSPNPINLNLNTDVVQVAPDVVSPVLTAPVISANKREFSVQRENRFVKKAGFQKRNESKEVTKNYDSDSGDGENHSNSIPKKQYPDENQLFIGNLLPNFCEEDLQNIFQQYGKILDVRINRQTHKIGSNKANRNYGFITFESPEVVDQIIAQKPIYFSNHRYNVEKKQGKSLFDRNRSNQNNNSRNASQSSTGAGTTTPRHSQANSAGQGNVGPRTRPGQNYNNVNNRNFNNGSNFVNRNQTFNNNNNNSNQNR